jgi:hypothetical protein
MWSVITIGFYTYIINDVIFSYYNLNYNEKIMWQAEAEHKDGNSYIPLHFHHNAGVYYGEAQKEQKWLNRQSRTAGNRTGGFRGIAKVEVKEAISGL